MRKVPQNVYKVSFEATLQFSFCLPSHLGKWNSYGKEFALLGADSFLKDLISVLKGHIVQGSKWEVIRVMNQWRLHYNYDSKSNFCGILLFPTQDLYILL